MKGRPNSSMGRLVSTSREDSDRKTLKKGKGSLLFANHLDHYHGQIEEETHISRGASAEKCGTARRLSAKRGNLSSAKSKRSLSRISGQSTTCTTDLVWGSEVDVAKLRVKTPIRPESDANRRVMAEQRAPSNLITINPNAGDCKWPSVWEKFSIRMSAPLATCVAKAAAAWRPGPAQFSEHNLRMYSESLNERLDSSLQYTKHLRLHDWLIDNNILAPDRFIYTPEWEPNLSLQSGMSTAPDSLHEPLSPDSEKGAPPTAYFEPVFSAEIL